MATPDDPLGWRQIADPYGWQQIAASRPGAGIPPEALRAILSGQVTLDDVMSQQQSQQQAPDPRMDYPQRGQRRLLRPRPRVDRPVGRP